MPAVKPGSKVLVTGASGFIAAWVARILLERGFYVRGTVRSTAKGEYLANLFKEHSDRFEYVIVEDIAKVECKAVAQGSRSKTDFESGWRF